MECSSQDLILNRVVFNFSVGIFLLQPVDFICSQALISISCFSGTQWLRITRSKGSIRYDAFLPEDGSRVGFRNPVVLKQFRIWTRFLRFKGRLVGLFQHCIRRLIVLLPQMSSFIHLQRSHAPYRSERRLLAKEGIITKEFS